MCYVPMMCLQQKCHVITSGWKNLAVTIAAWDFTKSSVAPPAEQDVHAAHC